MAKLTAEEIYGYARAAGFSPDQATTMTAIALAESGGNIDANATVGEDSRGLWQINVEAHGEKYGDLWDPANNARAAFAVSGGGENISPWTVTHAGRDMPYLQHQAAAQAAAAAYGDPADLGTWSGSPGYGNTVSAGSAEGALPPVDAPPAGPGDDVLPAFGTTGGPSAEVFVQQALAQDGDEYQWGVQADHGEANPDEFDCAELVEWAAAQAGIDDLADTSYSQYVQMRDAGGEISVEEALQTRGALLFRFGTEDADSDGLPDSRHVAISLGDGTTIEARGEKWGVGSWDAGDRFTAAAIIPGLDYGAAPIPTGIPTLAQAPAAEPSFVLSPRLQTVTQPQQPAPPPPPPPLDPNSPDTDKDGLTDAIEERYKLDPNSSDTDRDNISDGYEVSQYGTNPLKADTDRDGLADSNEIALGLNPLDRDTDDDGKIDSFGVLTDTTDSDADGLSDELEAILGTITGDIDSDDDGSTDLLEFEAGTDPLEALDNPLSAIAVGAPQPLVSLPFGGEDDDGDLGPLDDDTLD